jgi:uncharacterized membrane protein
MKLIELIYRRETRVPVLALTFATTVGVALVLARVGFTGNLKYGLLVANLVLAWIPLVLALLAQKQFATGGWRHWRFAALATGWLLFFPNAPYIFTDVVHVFRGSFRNFWADLTLIFIFGLTGLVLGFLSLYLMHALARRAWGQWRGWLFVLAVTGLSGFGIYLGRVLRFNSWDVLVKPVKLIQGVTSWAGNPLADSNTGAFPFLYAMFLFLAYVMLYALTHLPQMHTLPVRVEEKSLTPTPT